MRMRMCPLSVIVWRLRTAVALTLKSLPKERQGLSRAPWIGLDPRYLSSLGRRERLPRTKNCNCNCNRERLRVGRLLGLGRALGSILRQLEAREQQLAPL